MALLGRQDFRVIPSENLKPAKTLPEGSVRVAVMVLDFTDCLLGHPTKLGGLSELKTRLLKEQGYKVLTVRFNDITGLKKIQQIRVLQAKLNSLLQG